MRVFEDDPHFNAGRGSVFTNIETNELDAAIMDGKKLGAGAVANLRHIKNPILLARLVMEKSPHVLMAGEGAEAFAKENGIEIVDQKYFYTKERWDALKKVKAAEKSSAPGGKKFIISDQDRHGTVGAVALDQNGNLAAATSTGGTTSFARCDRSRCIESARSATSTSLLMASASAGRQTSLILLPANSSLIARSEP